MTNNFPSTVYADSRCRPFIVFAIIATRISAFFWLASMAAASVLWTVFPAAQVKTSGVNLTLVCGALLFHVQKLTIPVFVIVRGCSAWQELAPQPCLACTGAR